MSLDTIEAKLDAGERLTREDGLALFAADDLLALGAMADRARQQRHGRQAFYIANTHVNTTNVCVNRCGLCAFWRPPDDADAYCLSPEEVVARARPDIDAGATEIHVVGGCHPEMDLDYCTAVVAHLREAFPEVCIQAWTAVEVAYAAERSGTGVAEALERLKAAGLTGLPGGGAEIFAPDVRATICPNKISGDAWLAVQRRAHEAGLPTNATMLFGHVETVADRVDHLLQLRGLQDATGGIQSLIPLPFHPEGTAFPDLPGPTAVDNLKTMAVARLLLDNVPHLKAFWVMLGPDLAQVALRFGADDINGTVIREEITHAAGARTPQGLTADALCTLVRGVGCDPVERDTVYRRIERGADSRNWRRV